jgi:Lon protease-like protein
MNLKLPNSIPVFPLSGVIYFPKTNLPLNIFEQRYLDLVNDVFKKDKFMGMIQSSKKKDDIFKVGCLGKIEKFKKSNDGRVFINLTGVTRFEIVEEIKSPKLYREFKVDYKKFTLDLNDFSQKVHFESLMEKAKKFFTKNGLLINWIEFEKLDDTQKINTLAMIAPITNEEKQKLLESLSLQEKVVALEDIIGFYLHEINFNNQTVQ